jgi:CelD/BcsL family acetyltransferase involved in cellulose biosynthesis
LRVIEVDAQDRRWEAFVRDHPGGLIYHHPAWLHVLETEYGQETVCLACEDGAGAFHGILPLAWTKGFPIGSTVRTGRRLSSLPRTPVAGPLSAHDPATTALVAAAIDVVRTRPGTRLEIKASSPFSIDSNSGLTCVPWRKAYVLKLPGPTGDLRFGTARNRARLKWAVRKANRLEVAIRPAETRDDLRSWYDLYLETMRTHMTPPRPFRLFDVMWEVLRPLGLIRLLLAESGRRLIAGSLYMTFGSTVFYAFNGCRRSELRLRPNDFIQWHAIDQFRREGFREYDLGEVGSGNHGLAEFKAKWGADDRQLYRFYHPRPVSERLEETSEVAPGSQRVLQAGWRRVPLKVTAAVGDAVYRFL